MVQEDSTECRIIWLPIGKAPLTTLEYALFLRHVTENANPSVMGAKIEAQERYDLVDGQGSIPYIHWIRSQ